MPPLALSFRLPPFLQLLSYSRSAARTCSIMLSDGIPFELGTSIPTSERSRRPLVAPSRGTSLLLKHTTLLGSMLLGFPSRSSKGLNGTPETDAGLFLVVIDDDDDDDDDAEEEDEEEEEEEEEEKDDDDEEDDDDDDDDDDDEIG